MSAWAEFLQPTTAKPLAFYDHPFFGRWPAITTNSYGTGTSLYEGTMLSDTLQEKVVRKDLEQNASASCAFIFSLRFTTLF